MNAASAPATENPASLRYTLVTCSNYRFAINIVSVQEVLAYFRLTRVPNTKPYVSGVFNLRGKIYSVINMGQLLEIDIKKISEHPIIMLVGKQHDVIGIMVDQVNDMITIENKDIHQPVGDDLPAVFRRYISGYCEQDENRIYILDIPSLINQNLQYN